MKIIDLDSDSSSKPAPKISVSMRKSATVTNEILELKNQNNEIDNMSNSVNSSNLDIRPFDTNMDLNPKLKENGPVFPEP